MPSREENELLTRIGPGTAMGALMRRYWMPATISDQIAETVDQHVRIAPPVAAE